MKEFFEEYGRTVVTVLIILGIILVGYTIAGNGQNSAFGKFTTATVDSMSGQANNVTESAAWKTKSAVFEDNPLGVTGTYRDGTGQIAVKYSEGESFVTVSGKTELTTAVVNRAHAATRSSIATPWGKWSVMSFDIKSDKDVDALIDFNVNVEGARTNDAYSATNAKVEEDEINTKADYSYKFSMNSGRWKHINVLLENRNEKENPGHKPMTACNDILFKADNDTVHYQIKNLKYGIAD